MSGYYHISENLSPASQPASHFILSSEAWEWCAGLSLAPGSFCGVCCCLAVRVVGDLSPVDVVGCCGAGTFSGGESVWSRQVQAPPHSTCLHLSHLHRNVSYIALSLSA